MNSIEVLSVSKEYAKGFYALRDLTFSVEEGSFVSIVGPFGCGKTTLLNLLSGITEDYCGTIKIKDKSPVEARKTRKIGYVFQSPTLLPWRSVIENVTLPQEISGTEDKGVRAFELLKMVKLDCFTERRPDDLSGGMQQLVSIVRSLALDPDVLLLDEPFSCIDEINRSRFHDELLKIHKQTRKTTLLVTHSLTEAVYLSDRVIILTPNPGRLKKIIDIDLIRGSDTLCFSDEFLGYIKKIRMELSNE